MSRILNSRCKQKLHFPALATKATFGFCATKYFGYLQFVVVKENVVEVGRSFALLDSIVCTGLTPDTATHFAPCRELDRSSVARRPRIRGRGVCHHVYAWGNDRHPVFKAEEHYREYLKYLEIYSDRFYVEVMCYALMAWHIHLSVFDRTGRLSRFMRGLHGRYAQYYNKATGRVGHVFGERYNNRVVRTDEDNIWLSRYIHRQAVDAGIVEHPKDYAWSSYRAYVGLSRMGFLKPRMILDQFGRGQSVSRLYESFVMGEDSGPIDWSDLSAPAAVNGDMRGESIETRLIAAEECPDDDCLIKAVAERLGVNPSILLDPRGRRERKLRHEAFSILVRGYGLSAYRTSRLFNVTPRTVGKAVWS